MNQKADMIIQILLQAGANPKVRDAAGKTALDYAKEKGYTTIIQLLEEAQ